jgi:diguanylate cyclase (GGDEF)-like protein
MGDPSTRPREVAALLPFSILRYLGRAVGKAEAERVRLAAGESRPLAQLIERGAWCSLASTLAIGAAAAELTADPQIGRRGGEELFRFLVEVGIDDVHRGRGSVEAALDAVMEASSKVSVGRVAEIVDRGRRRLLVESHYLGDSEPHRLFCDYSLGYWSKIPSIFGAEGYAVELECEVRGDDRCLTQVSWTEPQANHDADSAAERTNSVFFQYEELQRMAADLIAAEDVSAVLDLVVQRAGHAVLAPRFLLAVQLHDTDRLRVHHVGFRDDAAAERTAKGIMAGRPPSSALVVEVASKSRVYGSIAAIYPKGTKGTDVDVRLMSAYAAHAAAALESTATSEQAHRDRDTAQALLDLSRRLAGAATVPEVAQRLVDALPALAGGCRGSLYLWDEASSRLVFGAADPSTPRETIPDELVIADFEGAAELLATGEPLWLDVDELTGDIKHLLESTGVAHNASIPVVARGEFLGLVSASFVQKITDDERALLIERLSAFADQAAIALDNARLIERTRHQATHDGLTGLPNRPMLEDRATQLLADARRSGRSLGLLFVDLDRFKNVNDTLGHHAGDDLIRQVALRLRRELREVDTLARLGGDEFVVLLPDVGDEAGAAAVAERLVQALAASFTVGWSEVFVTCSVGVAVSPCAGTDYQTLLQHADAAMYRAKAAGAGGWELHVPTVGGRQRRLELESALHGALANGELSVVYQPQVELRTGRIVGAEALVRWDHPVFGKVAPDVFIPIAEEAGLIGDIDRWVRLTALAQLRGWQDTGATGRDFRISFNVSTRELCNPYLPLQLAGDLAANGIDASVVELEITERVVMVDDESLVVILESLAAVGVRLAIDDFGTGSSVLRRLQRHPVDTLKIDRSFVGDLSAAGPSGAVVAALLQMGASLGIEVLAEGVETEQQRAALIGLGCSLAQGFLFSPPVGADELAGLLAAGWLAAPAATVPCRG